MILTQSEGGFLFSMSGLTLILLFMSLAVFGWLAIRYRNIRNFEFQISIFITSYVVGEIMEDYRMPFLSAFPYIGSQIHIASAVFLAMLLWLRLYSARKGGRSMIDKVEPVEEGGISGGSNDSNV
jgi:hypothetical protein